MIDFFELLDLPRSAHLDEEPLRERYHALAKGFHPDRAGSKAEREVFAEKSADLNQAWETLRHPVSRLRHLLELLAPGEKHDGGIDSGLLELFSKVGSAIQNTDAFLAKLRAAESALAKALLAEEQFEVQQALQAVSAEVTAETDAQLVELKTVEVELEQIRPLHLRLTFLDKWQKQINERLLGLMTAGM